jgi:hypothetical protein
LGLNDRLSCIANRDAVDFLDLDQLLLEVFVQGNDPPAFPFACFIGQMDMIANVAFGVSLRRVPPSSIASFRRV